MLAVYQWVNKKLLLVGNFRSESTIPKVGLRKKKSLSACIFTHKSRTFIYENGMSTDC